MVRMSGRRTKAHTHTDSISNLLIPISKMETRKPKKVYLPNTTGTRVKLNCTKFRSSLFLLAFYMFCASNVQLHTVWCFLL